MKKLVFIFLFIPFISFSQEFEDLLPDVAWSTILQNVAFQNTDTFTLDVAPLDFQEPGAFPLTYGNYIMDNRGFRYKVISESSGTLTVVDVFGAGFAPAINQLGYVYQSAGEGESKSLPTILFEKLSDKAFDYGYRLDMNILWSQLASKRLLASRIGTSIHWGGEMDTITGNKASFNIKAGSAHIADNYTDPENAKVKTIEWSNFNDVTATGIGIRNISYIYIDSLGNAIQSGDLITNEQKRDFVSIGTIVHPIGTGTVTQSVNVVNWNADIFLSFSDYLDAVGNRFNIEGNEFSSNGVNLNIDRSSGKMYGLGLNYGVNKQNPNVVESLDQSAYTFFLAYRGGVGLPAIASLSDTIPVNMYDPNGDGVLVPIPVGYCTTHRIFYDPITNITVVQYGQFAYDSQKKAVDSYRNENYDRISEIDRVPLRCVLVVCESITDLSDRDEATFINVNQFSDSPYDKIPQFDEFAEPVELLDGMSYKQQSIYFTDDGANVYLEIERNPIYGGGDMIYVLGQREFTLNCTTGPGAGGRAQIQLLLGSDGDARIQYVYVTRLGEDQVQLNVSESKPTGEYAMVWRGSLRSYTKYVEDGMKPFTTQRYTQAKEKDGVSMIITAAEKLRAQGAETSASYGPVPLVEIVQGTPDSLNFEVASGGVYQFYYQIFQALKSKTDGIRVLNPHANEVFGPLDYINDLAEIQYDASGNTLNNRSFNFIFVGAKNSANGDSIDWIGVNLPSDTYTFNSTESAITNLGGYAVTSVPTEADQVAFLLCRVTFRYKNGDWENLTLSQTGLNYFDLRGQPLGTTSGGTGTPSPTPVFNDNTFQVENASDATKIFKVNVGNVTTGNTRTLDIPDKNGTIALIDDIDNLVDTLKLTTLDSTGFTVDTSQVRGLDVFRTDINQNKSDIDVLQSKSHFPLLVNGDGPYYSFDGGNQILTLDSIDQDGIVGLNDTIKSITWQDVIDNGDESVSNSIRVTDISTITSGVGLEMRYVPSGNYGGVLSFDRDLSTYKGLRLDGSNVELLENGVIILTVDGGNVNIDGPLYVDEIIGNNTSLFISPSISNGRVKLNDMINFYGFNFTANPRIEPIVDASVNIGGASFRYKNGYFSSSLISNDVISTQYNINDANTYITEDGSSNMIFNDDNAGTHKLTDLAQTVTTLTETAGAVSWNYNDGNSATVTIDETTVITMSNVPDGGEGTIAITQGDAGDDDVTFVHAGLTVKWRGDDQELTDTSGAIDLVSYKRLGSNLFLTLGSNYVTQ
jgi:hypothetical protein